MGAWACRVCGHRNQYEDGPVCENCETDNSEDDVDQTFVLEREGLRVGFDGSAVVFGFPDGPVGELELDAARWLFGTAGPSVLYALRDFYLRDAADIG